MNKSINSEKNINELVGPPMALAESNTNGRRLTRIRICLWPSLLIILGIIGILISIKILTNTGYVTTTQIVSVKWISQSSDSTVLQDKKDIIYQFKNKTTTTDKNRKKRHAVNHSYHEGNVTSKEDVSMYEDFDFQKARKIIMEHNVSCNNKNKNEVCKDIVMKLKTSTKSKAIKVEEAKDSKNQALLLDKIERNKGQLEDKVILRENIQGTVPTDSSKRETHSTLDLPSERKQVLPYIEHINRHLYPNPYPYSSYGSNNWSPNLYPQPQTSVPLSDTCLLARLLKDSQTKGYYGILPEQYATLPNGYQTPYNNRYTSPIASNLYHHAREVEVHGHKVHPQDVDIFIRYLTPKPDKKETTSVVRPFNSTTREAQCSEGTMPCDNGEDCISERQWCDGNVDCADVSDEARCSCKSRVDKTRLCDGYFDCPFGEDEMGCNGCGENAFSCEDFDMNQSTCFYKEQRCNNIADCPNHKDEFECNSLSPSLHKKPLFAISNTEGFLQRNFKGDWYAVCKNPYMWAHDACRKETGLIIRPPFIQIVPIDPMSRVRFLNTGPGGLIETSNTCFNSSAVYVTCPDMLCGTRTLPTSQLLRENAAMEDRLYGRNKRFLLNHRPYVIFYDNNRIFYDNYNKREQVKNSFKNRNTFSKYSNVIKHRNDYIDEGRRKRAQSRVVGGRPSQPAAWPWMAAMYRNGMFHCGGVILTQSWVMSAAHCVHEFWNHYYEIQVGMLRRFSFSPQEQNHQVTHIMVNHKYNKQDMKNDVSLLKVDTSIQFSRWVRPICLPSPDTAGADWLWGPSPGTMCTAVGWGATVEHGPDPDHMREVEVPIWSDCKHEEDRAGKEICAGPIEGGKDACQGDSGGPLLCRNPLNSQQWYIAGIVSHGDGCARKGEPGVYTRVSIFVKWIRHHISSNALPTIQPKQQCPGFKCKSGILKCLHNKRVCDKIIDCLAGEDEMNCNVMRSFDDIFLSKMSNDNENIDNINKQSNKLNNFETSNRIELVTNNSETKSEIPRNVDEQLTVIEDNDDLENNFKYASTIELSISKSTEETKSSEKFESRISAEEQVTMDPNKSTLTTEIENINHGHMTTITINSSRELQSMSSVSKIDKERTAFEDKPNAKETDIEENWSTTDLSTAESHTEMTDTFTSTSTNQHSHHSQIDLSGSINNDLLQTNSQATNKITNQNSSKTGEMDEPESKSLIIELLPTTKSPSINENITDNNVNQHGVIRNNETSSQIDKSKSLPDFESKIDIIHKIEDLVLSELQPAKIRKKHLIPKIFECRYIAEIIEYRHRCDHKADCEDGTDELDCTCMDYLSTFNKNLLCDGVFDCADGHDEVDCYGCADDRFLCRHSQICLPEKYICDGKPQCPQGEDESNCYALSNGKELKFELDDRPKISLEGFLTKKHNKDWHVVCEDNLTTEQQELAAMHICRYLGFSSANRFIIKNINVKKGDLFNFKSEDQRSKRDVKSVPVHFEYRSEIDDDAIGRHILIKEPQLIKEQCVPNITKTCMSLYVFCDHSLFDDDIMPEHYRREVSTLPDKTWPWNAKIFVEGDYKCSGVLLDLSLVLVSQSCLWDTLIDQQHISVVLGSHRTLDSTNGPFEQIREVNLKTELYHSKIIILHLKEPVEYSSMVKPMVVTSSNILEDNSVCVAVGQDNRNSTVSIYLKGTTDNCNYNNRCFVRISDSHICPIGETSRRQWAGIISCHTELGWHPVASFVDSRGECGIGNHINATEIFNLKSDVRIVGKKTIFDLKKGEYSKMCDGIRCGRGRCINMMLVCDGVKDCEDGNDESELACENKTNMCLNDPHHRGCECSSGQLRCHNGKCIPKQLFNNGKDDCGDRTDEPEHVTCSRYLARVMPSGLCDGILHCHDRSDEDPMFCKCYAKKTYPCGKTSNVDHCVAPDMVCDGVRDCPNGEDEATCIGLNAPFGTPSGTGLVIVRSHGVWHTKCYPSQNHTRMELERICRELGFLSGHAKEVKYLETVIPHLHNNVRLDTFRDVMLNNNTKIKLRNTQEPLARAIFDETLENCNPVYIECL